MTNKRVFEYSRFYPKGIMCIGIVGFILGAFAVLFKGHSFDLIWIGLVFILLSLFLVYFNDHDFKVFDEGIEFAPLKSQVGKTFVSWSDLEAPYIHRTKHGPQIRLRIREEAKESLKVTFGQRLYAGQCIWISIGDMKEKDAVIFQEVESRYRGAHTLGHLSAP